MAIRLFQSNKIYLNFRIKNFRISSSSSNTTPDKSTKSTPVIPRNVLQHLIAVQLQQENGIVYDRRPFKIALQKGKTYYWCLCGRSKSQPFCDGTHRNMYLKITQGPIRFQVEESKEYWLCNCKHTVNRPFCDGTHKSKIVQEATATVRS